MSTSFLDRLSQVSEYRLSNTFNFLTPNKKSTTPHIDAGVHESDESGANLGITEMLIKGLLATNVQQTLVERNRPTLTMATTNQAKAWISNVYSYRDQKGVEPFYQLIHSEALNVYMFCPGFELMKDASDDELIAWLRKHHHLDLAKTTKMVYNFAMKETSVFDKEATEQYLQSFVSVSKREAASLQAVGEERICYEFVGGLSPPALKTYFLSLKL